MLYSEMKFIYHHISKLILFQYSGLKIFFKNILPSQNVFPNFAIEND